MGQLATAGHRCSSTGGSLEPRMGHRSIASAARRVADRKRWWWLGGTGSGYKLLLLLVSRTVEELRKYDHWDEWGDLWIDVWSDGWSVEWTTVDRGVVLRGESVADKHCISTNVYNVIVVVAVVKSG